LLPAVQNLTEWISQCYYGHCTGQTVI